MLQNLVFDILIFVHQNLCQTFRSISLSPKIWIGIFCFAVYKHQYTKMLFTTPSMVIDKLMKILKKRQNYILDVISWLLDPNTLMFIKLLVHQCRGVRKLAVFWHNSDFTDTFQIQVFIKHSIIFNLKQQSKSKTTAT